MLTHYSINYFVTDLAAIRKILENEAGGTCCPSCKMPFDKGKKRKLIDTCGHAKCYSCMFKNESCTICANTHRHHHRLHHQELHINSNNNDDDDTANDGGKFHGFQLFFISAPFPLTLSPYTTSLSLSFLLMTRH